MADLLESVDYQALSTLLGEDLLSVKENCGNVTVSVAAPRILDVLTELKQNPDLDYNFFSECLGVDYSEWKHSRDTTGRFEVVYNLLSTRRGVRIFIKIGVDDGQPVPTAKDIYLGAEFPEKEIGDLFGVVFTGNELAPGSRFLLPDDWVGFPLRKEYPLGGEDVLFDGGSRGPAVEDESAPHAGESFEGKTGSGEISQR